MTIEAPPRRIRAGQRGRVHEARPNEPAVTRCGVPTDHCDPADGPVTCKTCAGTRQWRGRHSIRPALAPDPERLADDLRRADAALLQLEAANGAVHDAWLIEQGVRNGLARFAPPPPSSRYPAPVRQVVDLVAELQLRYEDRQRLAACRSTAAAHGELLRLQGYLLPAADREEA